MENRSHILNSTPPTSCMRHAPKTYSSKCIRRGTDLNQLRMYNEKRAPPSHVSQETKTLTFITTEGPLSFGRVGVVILVLWKGGAHGNL